MNRNYGILIAVTIFFSSGLSFAVNPYDNIFEEKYGEYDNDQLQNAKRWVEKKRITVLLTLTFLTASAAYTTIGAIKHIGLAYSIFQNREQSFAGFLSDYYTSYFPQKAEIAIRKKLGSDSSNRWGTADLEQQEQFLKEMNLTENEKESLGVATLAPLGIPLALPMIFMVRYLINKIRWYGFEIDWLERYIANEEN